MALAKDAMVQAMLGHVLQHGIAEASLRPLARAAGTSDRMLIYHFGSKPQLIGELLLALGTTFGQVLDTQFAPRRARTRETCLTEIARITRSPQMRPMMRIWMQVLAAAAAGENAYLAAGGTIVERLLGWVTAQLPPDDLDPVGTAETMLVLVEGAVVLDLAGRSDIADRVLTGVFAA